jgi:hypothetical protein
LKVGNYLGDIGEKEILKINLKEIGPEIFDCFHVGL